MNAIAWVRRLSEASAELSVRLPPRIRGWSAAGLNLLLPPQCACCGCDTEPPADRILLCDGCRTILCGTQPAMCRQCGATVPAITGSEPGCSRCRGRRWHFKEVIPLGMYRDELRRAVLRMKRGSEEPLAMAMGRLLAAHVSGRFAEAWPDAVVPVPMHWTRRLARGTNSPDLLAAQLAGPLRTKVERTLLVRTRRTQPHGSLSRRKRYRNMAGAFAVRSGYELAGARIVLVDDILTTGVTCNEAARVLKAAGAASVSVVVIARAEGRE